MCMFVCVCVWVCVCACVCERGGERGGTTYGSTCFFTVGLFNIFVIVKSAVVSCLELFFLLSPFEKGLHYCSSFFDMVHLEGAKKKKRLSKNLKSSPDSVFADLRILYALYFFYELVSSNQFLFSVETYSVVLEQFLYQLTFIPLKKLLKEQSTSIKMYNGI